MQYLNIKNFADLLDLAPNHPNFRILRSVLKNVRINVNVPQRHPARPARPIKDLVLRAGNYEFTAGSRHWTVKVRAPSCATFR